MKPAFGGKILEYVYRFQFKNGETQYFSVGLDQRSLSLLGRATPPLPAWTELEFRKCPNCPLDPERVKHCPAAVGLVDVIETFGPRISYEEVEVRVTSGARE